jgi:hypothetical protein
MCSRELIFTVWLLCWCADVFSVLEPGHSPEGPPSSRASPVKASKHIPYRCAHKQSLQSQVQASLLFVHGITLVERVKACGDIPVAKSGVSKAMTSHDKATVCHDSTNMG